MQRLVHAERDAGAGFREMIGGHFLRNQIWTKLHSFCINRADIAVDSTTLQDVALTLSLMEPFCNGRYREKERAPKEASI